MVNIFFKVPRKAPKDHKLVDVMVGDGMGVLIYEKRKELLKAKLKQKRKS